MYRTGLDATVFILVFLILLPVMPLVKVPHVQDEQLTGFDCRPGAIVYDEADALELFYRIFWYFGRQRYDRIIIFMLLPDIPVSHVLSLRDDGYNAMAFGWPFI